MQTSLVDEKGLYVTNDPQLSDEKFMYMLELIKEYAIDQSNRTLDN